MQKLQIGTSHFTEVSVMDEPGAGGACHEYKVEPAQGAAYQSDAQDGPFAVVHFQKGPVGEAGVNGCHQEDLLAIVIHRLQCFQAGPFACRENALALTKLEEAMHWLNHRTASRQKRGVEGTSKV